MRARDNIVVGFVAVASSLLGALLATRGGPESRVAAQNQSNDVVSAGRFRVVDQAGALRAEFDQNGLRLSDARGIRRISLNVADDGTAFALFYDKANPDGRYMTTFQPPSINFIGPDGRVISSLTGNAQRSLPPIALLSGPCVPAPGTRCPSNAADEAGLQAQIDSLRNKVNELARFVNMLNH
jgi:hypothetical protein